MTNHTADYVREWRHRHPEVMRQVNKKHFDKIRGLVLDTFGRKCVKCGSTEKRLELDRVHPLVRLVKRNTISYWIDALVFPKKYFQILCRSCNVEKANKGRRRET